ncbi:DUF4760 domain-containing protein [Streptomyces gilvus]|uniref:DUF4760 domain-containing protein n=1 Tax=Streptomyces gilvus TaxID=2920937 RepID=UPI001F1144F1|nr:DUF4760 domain-containing protein [Streptomyces sp. CME 23]MCH5676553.1 DUF4760 domain-containing protein [Streptomyces sp. CME 23]
MDAGNRFATCVYSVGYAAVTPYEYSSLTLGLVAFAAVVWQLRMLSRSTDQDHDRRRKQATMEYLTANMDRRKALFDQGIPAERDRRGIADLINLSLSGDDHATKQITAYLTTYNFLAVGAQADAFDQEVIHEAWGGFIIAVWNNYRPWIEAQREKHGEPSVYENLEWLAGHMTTLRSARSAMNAGNLPRQGQPVL